jgi:hypothetical protein
MDEIPVPPAEPDLQLQFLTPPSTHTQPGDPELPLPPLANALRPLPAPDQTEFTTLRDPL